MPLAYDAVSARIIELAGFEAAGTSGSNIAASLLGVPDIALTTLTEMTNQNRNIVNAVKIPIIADADNGFGKALNVRRAVQEYETAGLAGMFFEDQVHPKRCGHYPNTQVISSDEMISKVRAAVEGRRDPDFVLVARTDALSSLGFEEAVTRGNLYAEAGADVIFVEAMRSKEEILDLPKRIKAPLLINLVEGGKTPILDAKALQAAGYRVIFYPDMAMTAAVYAMQKAMTALRRDGTSANIQDQLIGFDPLQELLRFSEFERLQQRYDDVAQGKRPKN